MSVIHIVMKNGQAAEYEEEQVRSLLKEGLLRDDVLYWKEGMTDWEPLRNLLVPEVTAPQSPPPIPEAEIVQNPALQEPRTPSIKAKVRLNPVLRDVAIIWILSFIGGTIVGIADRSRGNAPDHTNAIAVSNLLLCTVGFVISGCLAPPNRWQHLRKVALWSWLTSIINIPFGVSIGNWLMSIVALFIMMGIGGGISYLIKKGT